MQGRVQGRADVFRLHLYSIAHFLWRPNGLVSKQKHTFIYLSLAAVGALLLLAPGTAVVSLVSDCLFMHSFLYRSLETAAPAMTYKKHP